MTLREEGPLKVYSCLCAAKIWTLIGKEGHLSGSGCSWGPPPPTPASTWREKVKHGSQDAWSSFSRVIRPKLSVSASADLTSFPRILFVCFGLGSKWNRRNLVLSAFCLFRNLPPENHGEDHKHNDYFFGPIYWAIKCDEYVMHYGECWN